MSPFVKVLSPKVVILTKLSKVVNIVQICENESCKGIYDVKGFI